MTARRSLAALALLVLPGIAGAQMCNSLAYFQPKERHTFVGGRVDLVQNANSYGGTFGITASANDKPMSMLIDLRTIQFTGSSAIGFGFTFDKALIAKPTWQICGFAGGDIVSVSGSSTNTYLVGAAWGDATDMGEAKLLMSIRLGYAFSIPSVGPTSSDPFSEIGLGLAFKNGLTIIPQYVGVFDGVSDPYVRLRVTYPLGSKK